MKTCAILSLIAAGAICGAARAVPIRVQLSGYIDSNPVTNINCTLFGVPVGTKFVWKFTIDSDAGVDYFVDTPNNLHNPNFRMFAIPVDGAYSYTLYTPGGPVVIPMHVPSPYAQLTPHFTINWGFPVSNHLFISNDTSAQGVAGTGGSLVPIEVGTVQRASGYAGIGYGMTFAQNVLHSLSLTDALGTYNCNVVDGAFTNESSLSAGVGVGNGMLGTHVIGNCPEPTPEYNGKLIISCPADLDDGSGSGVPDAGVDINDLLFFLAAYEAGDISADVDDGAGNGVPDAGVDINDLLFFLTHYEAGC